MGCMSADTILPAGPSPAFKGERKVNPRPSNSLLFHTLQLFGKRWGEVKIIMKLTHPHFFFHSNSLGWRDPLVTWANPSPSLQEAVLDG
jgi:hypothetical protein